ncbi:hypothetical protein BACERE00187_02393 [Bacillus cereus]|nr:hypothetical protein BACERE00187_02393 [Bacillus cereus]
MKNTITQEDINSILERTQFTVEEFHDKCTVVVAKLPNGFILMESSACVDPSNYDVNIGIEICKDRITNKIWELEGYRLQSKIYDIKEFQKQAKATNLLSEEKIEQTVEEMSNNLK